MTNDSMALVDLMQKAGEGDFLRGVAEAVLQMLMEADVEGQIGAGRHERSGDRLNYRNGYRDRPLDTRLGTSVPGSVILPWHSDTQIVRHTKVKGRASALGSDARPYWEERRRKRREARSLSRRRQELLHAQGYGCAACGVPFDPDEDVAMMDGHHAKPRHRGGGDKTGNLRLLHRWCHHRYHQQVGYKAAEA